jgi:hypothetical protein
MDENLRGNNKKFGINPKQERNEENHTHDQRVAERSGIIRTCEKERECGDG